MQSLRKLVPVTSKRLTLSLVAGDVMNLLGRVADIRGGQLSQGDPVRASSTDACLALQVGDLASDGSVAWSALRMVIPAGSWQRSVIQNGDVLIPLRSTKVTAIVARDVPPQTIALGHWAIITTGPTLLPEYLAWFLSHPTTARQWRLAEVGSNIAFVPLSAVRELEIEVPPLDVQERIVSVDALHRRLGELERQLTDTRNRYVHQITRAALDRAATSND